MTSSVTPSHAHAPAALTLDLGTSHVKAALIDSDATVWAEASAPMETRRGPHGRMHQSVEEWRSASAKALQAVLAASGRADSEQAPTAGTRTEGMRPQTEAPSPVVLAVTGQMQDLILLDAQGAPTHPVVLYSDTEAEPELASLLTARPDWASRLLLAPGPDAIPPKLLHLAHTAPEALHGARTLLVSAAGWLAYALTGRSVCDRLTASTTSAYFTRSDDWFPFGPAFDHLEFPALVDPGVVGAVTQRGAAEFGLPEGMPVVMGLGDAGASTDGMVGSAPGSLYLHLGTTGWAAHVSPVPAAKLPLPAETGEPGAHHRLTHPAGHLSLARMPQAGEYLEAARRSELGLEDPHSAEAHEAAEAALTRALRSERARMGGVSETSGSEAAASETAGSETAVSETAVSESGASETAGSENRKDGRDVSAQEPATCTSTRDADRAYLKAVREMAEEARELLARLEATPESLPVTGGVVRSAGVRAVLEETLGMPVVLIPHAEAGLRSCARVAFDGLGIEHSVTPLVE